MIGRRSRRSRFDRAADEAVELANSGSWERWCACGRVCMPVDWRPPVILADHTFHSSTRCQQLDTCTCDDGAPG